MFRLMYFLNFMLAHHQNYAGKLQKISSICDHNLRIAILNIQFGFSDVVWIKLLF